MRRSSWRSTLGGVCAALAAAAIPATAGTPALGGQSYGDLERAVLDGRDIRVTLDLGACRVHGTALAVPPVRGSIRFDAYMIESDGDGSGMAA